MNLASDSISLTDLFLYSLKHRREAGYEMFHVPPLERAEKYS